jgi:hypothetical protein
MTFDASVRSDRSAQGDRSTLRSDRPTKRGRKGSLKVEQDAVGGARLTGLTPRSQQENGLGETGALQTAPGSFSLRCVVSDDARAGHDE